VIVPGSTIYIIDGDSQVNVYPDRVFKPAGFATILYDTATAFINDGPHSGSGCILLDIGQPMTEDEIETIIKRLRTMLPIIVMTGCAAVHTAVRAMKAGAVDFIVKPPDDALLLAAVKQALARRRHPTSRELADAAQRVGSLTARERQVLEGLRLGETTRTIAANLGLSARTVGVHRARMMKRLGVRHYTEAIRLLVLAELPEHPGNH
jgi:two-component system response regulator FixJ